MTALPTFNAGTEPTAAQWQTLLPISGIKAADQTVNNSATLVNDSALVVPVAANAKYAMDLFVVYNSGTTPDIKFQFTAPAGATLVWAHFGPDLAMASFVAGTTWTANTLASVPSAGGIGGDVGMRGYGLLTTAGSSGSLQLQWAQNTANASNTIVRAGSFLFLQQLA